MKGRAGEDEWTQSTEERKGTKAQYEAFLSSEDSSSCPLIRGLFSQPPPLRPWGNKEQLHTIFGLEFPCPELPWPISRNQGPWLASLQCTVHLLRCRLSSSPVSPTQGPNSWRLLASTWYSERNTSVVWNRGISPQNQCSPKVFRYNSTSSCHVLDVVRDIE